MLDPVHTGSDAHDDIGPLEATVTLPNKAGLHARSAAVLVKAAARFQAGVTLSLGERHASARSLMELLRLGARQGHAVHIRVEGPDAAAAMHEIKTMVDDGFGEE